MILPRELSQDPVLHRLLELAGEQEARIYLVGGAVRDLLAGLPLADLDLAVDQGGLELARRLARAVRGAFVPLDPEHDTARVVIRGICWDLAGLRAESIREDLLLRDFTMNSMAVELLPGRLEVPLEILDPAGGRADLETKRILPSGPTSLADDPARVLRAYRFSSQLGWPLPEETRKAARGAASGLERVAGERLAQEWRLLAAGPGFQEVLPAMEEDRILEISLVSVEPSIELAQRVELTLTTDQGLLGEVLRSSLVDLWSHDSRRWIGRLGLMLSGDSAGADAAAERLKLSRRERRELQEIGRGVRQATELLRRESWSAEDLLELFGRSGCWAPLLVAGAGLATVEPAPPELVRQLWREYRERVEPVLESPPLVRGGELVERLGRAGPVVGEMLRRIELARIEGRISTREEALTLIDPSG